MSSGPSVPGAWAPTPRDERRRDDVANMLPPTIHEPSQELAEAQRAAHTSEKPSERRGREGSTAVPVRVSEGEEAKRTEAGSQRVSPTRRGSDTSGWVWVNIEGREGAKKSGTKGKEREVVAPNSARGRGKSPNSGDMLSSTRRSRIPGAVPTRVSIARRRR
ncbi:hypothetical protein B0H21DRAFT_395074 [Amylocystis lapponica]|nr:hypothetical protein B0H21DRAFT_395074 [Amylocystis lapponica]